MSGSDVYQHDPQAASDDAFERGTLGHLVPENRGRMLDPRRTPVTVTGVDSARGLFEVVVEAFEDAGAHWRVPLEDVPRFQFGRGCKLLPERDVQTLEALVARFDRPLEIRASEQARARTLREISEKRAQIKNELRGYPELQSIEFDSCVRSRRGSQAAADALARLVDAAGVAGLEQSLTQSYVSNPHSGEAVKGHAIVIAEMGLCTYRGKIVRDDALFEGDGCGERRRAHIVLRLAFLGELMALLGLTSVELYRGMAIDRALRPPQTSSLVAATLAREVAMSHFESEADVAVLVRQRVPVSRLLMTFLETSAMNERYLEAEAVLIGEADNPAF